jgi:hypothetical protein
VWYRFSFEIPGDWPHRNGAIDAFGRDGYNLGFSLCHFILLNVDGRKGRMPPAVVKGENRPISVN